MIWKQPVDLEMINNLPNNLTHHIGIKFTEYGDDHLKATMPVDHRTRQPFGLLHGGASCVLAETLGSVASNLCIEKHQFAVGIEINASHLRAAKDGYVTGLCKPIRLGSSLHVWQIDIENLLHELVATARLTVAIRSKDPLALLLNCFLVRAGMLAIGSSGQ